MDLLHLIIVYCNVQEHIITEYKQLQVVYIRARSVCLPNPLWSKHWAVTVKNGSLSGFIAVPDLKNLSSCHKMLLISVLVQSRWWIWAWSKSMLQSVGVLQTVFKFLINEQFIFNKFVNRIMKAHHLSNQITCRFQSKWIRKPEK